MMLLDDSDVIRIFRRMTRAGNNRSARDCVELTGTVEHVLSGERGVSRCRGTEGAVLPQSGEKTVR